MYIIKRSESCHNTIFVSPAKAKFSIYESKAIVDFSMAALEKADIEVMNILLRKKIVYHFSAMV